MFSVGARPFNSRRRQLYGGWAANIDANTDEATALAGWDASPAAFVQDTKWASMAERYAFDPDERDLASTIREYSKGYLSGKRTAAKNGDGTAMSWLDRYNKANKVIRSPFKMSSLSASQKDAIWSRFKNMAWNPAGLTNAERMFLQLSNRAPFGRSPTLPEGVAVPGLTDFVDDDLMYTRPGRLSAAQRRYLGRARRGELLDPTDYARNMAVQAYRSAISNGANAQAALAIAQSVAGANNAANVPVWIQQSLPPQVQ